MDFDFLGERITEDNENNETGNKIRFSKLL
jgi:hypothetical protein